MPTIGRTKLPVRNCCYFTFVAPNDLHAPTVMAQGVQIRIEWLCKQCSPLVASCRHSFPAVWHATVRFVHGMLLWLAWACGHWHRHLVFAPPLHA
eukprot:7549243-Lingulodinium_polyedra.AAC.1